MLSSLFLGKEGQGEGKPLLIPPSSKRMEEAFHVNVIPKYGSCFRKES